MGLTTNYSWPLPELTDPPDGPGQLKALGNAIDAQVKLGDPSTFPVLRVRRTTVFPVASGNAPVAVPFNVKDEDVAGMSNAAGDIVTVKTAGIWLITAMVCFGPNATANRLLDLKVNAVAKATTTTVGLANVWGPGLNLAATMRLAVNDTIVIGVAQNSGVSVNVDIGYPPFLAMDWLRP